MFGSQFSFGLMYYLCCVIQKKKKKITSLKKEVTMKKNLFAQTKADALEYNKK